MAVDLEQLVVELGADMVKYGQEMSLAYKVTTGVLDRIEKRFDTAEQRVSTVGRRIGSGFKAGLAAIGVGLSLNELTQYVDLWKRAENALATANIPAREQNYILGRLYDQAQDYGVALNDQVDLYASLSRAAGDLTDNQEDLFRFSEGVAAALKVQGRSASQTSGALLQLTQLIRGANVQAQEYNSLIDGAPAILEAVAAGMKRTGGSVGELSRLVKEGEVTSREFFESFLRGSDQLIERSALAATTFDQAFTKIDNAFLKYIGETDEGLAASQRVIEGLSTLADNFEAAADSAIQLASIIAGALVGRAIAGMLLNIPLAVVAIRLLVVGAQAAGGAASFMAANFGRATAAVRGFTVVSRGLRLAAIYYAAQPLGLLLGAVATAATLYATGADEGAKSSERLTDEMRRLGIISDETAGHISEVDAAIDDVTEGARAQKLREIADNMERIKGGSGLFGSLFTDTSELERLVDIIGRAAEMQTGLVDRLTLSGGDRSVVRNVEDLARGLRSGSLEADEVLAGLEELKRIEVSAEVDALINALERTAGLLAGNIELQRRYNEEAGKATDSGPSLQDRLEEIAAQTRAFIGERERRSLLSDQDKAIEDRTKQIIKEAQDAGTMVTEALALIQATREVEREFAKKAPKAREEPASPYEREVSSIQQSTEALRLEAEAVGLSAFEAEKARMAFELLAAAKESNLAITPALIEDVDRLATSYAMAAEQTEAMQTEYQRMQEFQQEIAGTAADAFSAIIVRGEKASDVLARLAQRFAEAAIEAAALNAVSALLGDPSEAGSGGFGGFIRTLLGRASGGPVNTGQPYLVGERGRELFVPTSAGRIVSNGKLGGGQSPVTVVVNNTNGSKIETRDSRGPSGREIEVLVEDAIDKRMKGKYGMRPALGRR